MNRLLSTEIVYQLFALLLSFIIVHGVYVALVRPQADKVLAQQTAQMQADPDYVPEQSLYVVLKDYEQETTFVLFFWAVAILGYKGRSVLRQQRHLETDLIGHGADIITPSEAPAIISHIDQSLGDQERDFILPRALTMALERFIATRRVPDASAAAIQTLESEAERMESELSIIRYIAWAIPSIGFIGTVRGIGQALGQAHRAVEGDISGVTQSLGTAFNSTFVALVLSIILMFVIHQLQRAQERLVLDAGNYCESSLTRFLRSDIA
ncbi:MAG: MotA/TolQ/ExbB proton channel family protein [Alphaproteobacteria bacterium]|nr:MAG: MotA/TolQ/ExbB proton channel family protein [Alphaproteobacteria bacterium]